MRVVACDSHARGLTLRRVNNPAHHLDQPVLSLARKDFTRLPGEATVGAALDQIREKGIGEKIIYFYVIDADERLIGVLPTRRLLTGKLDQRISDLMISRVVAIPQTATVMDACELFLIHKYLAFPVIDEQRRLVGVVDVSLFTEEVLDISEKERMDDVFQTIGFHVAQVQSASPVTSFRHRFPWLLATIGSGTACALLAGLYETTLAQSLVIAFFMALVLGLGESVSVQSLTVTVQALHAQPITLNWFLRAARKELATAAMLGAASGLIVALIVWFWRHDAKAAVVVGFSLLLAICMACLIGLSVPSLLHRLKLDPKIAAGPIALALADIATLLFYFNLARWLLK
jgi:magnesium transporter